VTSLLAEANVGERLRLFASLVIVCAQKTSGGAKLFLILFGLMWRELVLATGCLEISSLGEPVSAAACGKRHRVNEDSRELNTVQEAS
jgi:hypothetical protein